VDDIENKVKVLGVLLRAKSEPYLLYEYNNSITYLIGTLLHEKHKVRHSLNA
jgi:hypothetical protein